MGSACSTKAKVTALSWRTMVPFPGPSGFFRRYTPVAAASGGARPSAARSGTVSLGRVTNGAMTAGRRRSAAASSGQISCGSQGVRVIDVPRGKFSCRSCRAWGSAWVGPSSPVFNPAWAQTRIIGGQGPCGARAWHPMAWRRAATWPRGARKAP